MKGFYVESTQEAWRRDQSIYNYKEMQKIPLKTGFYDLKLFARKYSRTSSKSHIINSPNLSQPCLMPVPCKRLLFINPVNPMIKSVMLDPRFQCCRQFWTLKMLSFFMQVPKQPQPQFSASIPQRSSQFLRHTAMLQHILKPSMKLSASSRSSIQFVCRSDCLKPQQSVRRDMIERLVLLPQGLK